MLRSVRQFIEKEQLLCDGDAVVVGLSGGADSVVLLHLLHRLGYRCIAAHCNFHLRGDESDRDEHFAAAFAHSLSVPFLKRDFDTRAVAAERSISIEMAARDLRYAWFEDVMNAEQAVAVAVAHHQNDSIETMLLNLLRGAGIAGLTGIKPRNRFVIRPLLCLSKADILEYAAQKQLPFVTDSSNLSDEYMRNKIRRQLLPALQSINPSAETALLNSMEALQEAAKIYDTHVSETTGKIFDAERGAIDIALLQQTPSPESLLFEILKKYDFGREVIKDVYRAINSQSGKEFFSATHRLIRDRNCFFLLPLEQNRSDSIYYIDKNIKEIQVPFQMQVSIVERITEIDRSKHAACFDYDKLKFPLILRRWQIGDRFVPFGMKGSQKLSDFFNNLKMSRYDKENVWLLCSGDDIIWIVGYRTDNRYKIEKNTSRCYLLKVNCSQTS